MQPRRGRDSLRLFKKAIRRALVVDDDVCDRRLAGVALGTCGFEVFSAADGREGVHSLIDLLLSLDLALIKHQVPCMDGEALLRLVRERGGERELTLVVMVDQADPALHARLMAAGADAVVAKSEGIGWVVEVAVQTLERRSEPAGVGAQAARLGEPAGTQAAGLSATQPSPGGR